MEKEKQSVGKFIQFLQGKGFSIGEDAIGFIYFGMEYTAARSTLVKAAIEITLKVQKRFDGSFYISLLEAMKEAGVKTKKDAYQFASNKKLL